MTKAEEAAIKAYPDNDVLFFAEDADGNTHPVTTFGREMNGFIFGYEQAEKDLALTWQDIAKIDDMLREVQNCIATSDLPTMGREKYYEEVLRRYNELKNNERN